MESEKDLNNEVNIQVAIRVRPLLHKEKQKQHHSTLRVENNIIVVQDPIETKMEQEKRQKMDVLHWSREQYYSFDHIFTEHQIDHIYDQTALGLVDSLFQGYNGCVFAYGATGTGKTFTMMGDENHKGMIQICLEDIFLKKKQKQNQASVSIKVQYVEIYNEQIKDLLEEDKKYCNLWEDPVKGVVIQGAKKIKVQETRSIMDLLVQGNRKRTTEFTNANEASSRSHAVLQIMIKIEQKSQGVKMESLKAKLSLIDLAGSERGTVTENRGIWMREGAKINQSLLALANVINALADKNKKNQFVSFRDSKLTWLLRDSLGGNCKTVMIVTISPSSGFFEETVNTLKYAQRAKNIKTKPVENKKTMEFQLSEYKWIKEELKNEVQEMRIKMGNDVIQKGVKNCQECEQQQQKVIKEFLLVKNKIYINLNEQLLVEEKKFWMQKKLEINEVKQEKLWLEIFKEVFLKQKELNIPQGESQQDTQNSLDRFKQEFKELIKEAFLIADNLVSKEFILLSLQNEYKQHLNKIQQQQTTIEIYLNEILVKIQQWFSLRQFSQDLNIQKYQAKNLNQIRSENKRKNDPQELEQFQKLKLNTEVLDSK